jgi:hypothetical protein
LKRAGTNVVIKKLFWLERVLKKLERLYWVPKGKIG